MPLIFSPPLMVNTAIVQMLSRPLFQGHWYFSLHAESCTFPAAPHADSGHLHRPTCHLHPPLQSHYAGPLHIATAAMCLGCHCGTIFLQARAVFCNI